MSYSDFYEQRTCKNTINFNKSGTSQNSTTSPLATGKLPTGEQVAFDLLPADAYLELGPEPTVDLDDVPLVAGGYIDDQSKWYDGTGEWLLFLLGFLSGGLMTWLIIYAVGRFL